MISSGERPASSISMPFRPYGVLAAPAWEAIIPTPGLPYGTVRPARKARDCTARPSSPVAGSRATIENVATVSSAPFTSSGGRSCPEAAGTVNIQTIQSFFMSTSRVGTEPGSTAPAGLYRKTGPKVKHAFLLDQQASPFSRDP